MIGSWQKIWTPPTGFPLALEELPAPPEEVEVPAGQSRNTMYRMRLDNGCDGAVGLVFKGESLCFVQQIRVAVEEELWELPRGMGELSDQSPIATAQREVLEEAGIVTTPIAFLGRLWVDSALLKNAINVVALEYQSETGQTDGEISAMKWIPLSELPNMLANGQLTDGITIAALGAWQLAGCPRKK